ncbi:MAG: shikimate dehydrogenase [Gammaproteobacteria bacterium]|nr:shikimate dehydrogenase [Gammaproteobacteria bacterium]
MPKNLSPCRLALIGNPVAHSLSPLIHREFARQTGQAVTYEVRCVPLKCFVEGVQAFVDEGGVGFNVTIPFKEEAYRWVTRLTERARIAQAVNTVFLKDGLWWGDNTDGVGFVRDLAYVGISICNQRVLILGAGGAARGIISALLLENPKEIVIANRTFEKGEALAVYFQRMKGACSIRAVAISKNPLIADLIIHATSQELPLLAPKSCRGTGCYDLAYSTQETPFQKWAVQNGAANALNGLGMLVEQAAESFFIWTGVRPKDTRSMIARLLTMPSPQLKNNSM